MKKTISLLLAAFLVFPPSSAWAAGPEITSFNITGERFLIEGELATITWSSRDATSCTADGNWLGNKEASGSYSFYPSEIGLGRFQLVCSDASGAKSTPRILTPFIGSSGTQKQRGELAIASAKVTSTDPDKVTVVAEATRTPTVASIVLHEQTASPADFASKVSMFLPSTAITGSTLTFTFDGPARPATGKSYAYTITAQGATTADLATYNGTITIDTEFKIETTRVGTPTMSDGSRLEYARDIYVTFSRPAINVKTRVTSYNEAGTQLNSDYTRSQEYASHLYSSTQKTFAAGGYNDLPRGRKFQYIVEGQDRATSKTATYTGQFFTAPEIMASDVVIKPGDTYAIITWKTNVPTGSAVEYKQGNQQSQFSFSTQSYPQTSHEIAVENLKPETNYTATIHAYIHNDTETDTTFKTHPISFTTTSELILCPAYIDPVCGKDNKTYSNDCLAAGAKMSVAYRGECVSYKIDSVRLDKLDALGKATEEERSFAIQVSHPFSEIVISLWESPNTSITQTPHMSATVKGNGTLRSIYVSPGVFNKKLQPNKIYKYLVTAYKYGATQDINTSFGDTFTTSSFSSPVQGKRGAITVSLSTLNTLVDPGSPVVLTWTSTQADYCTASGGWSGKKEPSGSEAVIPKDDTTLYGIQCFNADGPGPGTMVDVILKSNAVAPVVSFQADKYLLKKGESVRLSWNTNAASCQSYADILQNGVFEGDQSNVWSANASVRKTSGTQTMSPSVTTKYTLNCFIKEKQTIRTLVAIVDGKTAPSSSGPIHLSSVKVFDQGDPTTQYVTYDYGYTPADGTLYQKLNVFKKSTGASIIEKQIFQEKNSSPSTSVSISGFEPNTPYRYELTLVDPSDGRTAQRTGEFTTGVLTKKEEPKVCATVMTLGRNTKTGEYKQFPNSCLDDGWEYVTSDVKEMEKYLKPKEVKEKSDASREEQARGIEEKVRLLSDRKLDVILSELQQLRDKVKEQETELKYLRKVSAELKGLSEGMREALTSFVTYGVDSNTKGLGAGERAAVVGSYQAAYGKLPDSDKELEDMIRIANGRFPSERNEAAERTSQTQFKRIFKRVANMHNANDRAAIMVMAYGLRQAAENRNLKSETRGIATFEGIYGRKPGKTDEWNTMQAITYSGASRKKDSDKDLLADEDEKDYATNPNNPDSDGDGYIDGLEIENGYNPTGEGQLIILE
ncbi:MAG: Kazal-type serine protease inhibitor domain-containing protein [Patescibacteria group bacterium]